MKKTGLLGAYVSIIERIGGVRTNVRRVLRPLYLRREIRRAEEALPGMARVAERLGASQDSLETQYADYTSTVSTDVFALSLRTSALIDAYCSVLRPRSVLDLGSGFSSFVLRRYQRTSVEPVLVTSVDDNDAWLRRTSDYLARSGLSTEGLIRLESFGGAPAGGFDFVCYDLGNFETRRRHLPTALRLAKPGSGVVLLDDCHRISYRDHVRGELSSRAVRPIELQELTRDSFGRFCWLVTLLAEPAPRDS